MKQFGIDHESEIERVKDSLLKMMEEFEHYRADYERACEKVRLLIVQRVSGFSNSSEGELQEQRMTDAVQVYNRLRIQIDWWQKRIQLIVARISKIERQASGKEEIFVDDVIRESALLNLSGN
jgi:nitrogen regulatory protein PII